tara:strand:- start:513 stop:767 length:255 start_codon:yes stop_codon:yes gene_type:complete
MATVRTPIDSSVFLEVSTAADAIVQNAGVSLVTVIFSGSLPAATEEGHPLSRGEAIQKIGGKPAGNIYVRMIDDGKSGTVAVSE